nr:ATP dependent RNA helicase DDX11 [Hymenolepis microstoma]
MDDFENDVAGDQLIANLSFDGIAGNLPSQTPGFTSMPVFKSPTRSDFPGFPYPEPYSQQVDLMRFLYGTLASSKCAVIESPTGTGKSATLLTGSLHWLLDHNNAVGEYITNLRNYLQKESTRLSEESDWVAAHSLKRELRLQVDKKLEPLEITQKALEQASEIIKRSEDVKLLSKMSRSGELPNNIPRDPFSSIDVNWGKSDDDCFLPSESGKSTVSEELPIERDRVFQIIYSSRTHSQLSQVVEEVYKLKDVLSDHITLVTLASRQHLCVNKKVYELKNQQFIREACLDLASKRPGCKFRCKADVNELSDYLLGARISSVDAAIKIRDNPEGTDIEDLPIRSCPYYANKRGLPLAQLVLAPYQTVIVPGQREAIGLHLQDSVLIIDEAHNLLEALAEAFSSTITYNDLLLTERLTNAFLEYYRSRLSSLSALRLRQLNLIIGGFKNLLDGKIARGCQRQKDSENKVPTGGNMVYKLGDFLFAAGLDHINFSYVVDYLRSDRCVHKVAGFGKWFGEKRKRMKLEKEVGKEKDETEEPKAVGTGLSFSACLKQLKRPPSSSESQSKSNPSKRAKFGEIQATKNVLTTTPVNTEQSFEDLQSAGTCLFSVLNFLEALVNSDHGDDDDGRVIVTPKSASSDTISEPSSRSLRFVILNPGRYLHDAVKQARSVILVGGTMKPFDEFIDQVFLPAGKGDTDVSIFSCGHVINTKNQLSIYATSESPGNITWDFTFKNRNDPRLISECGEFLIEICKLTPGGVAVFFPSFDYLALVWNRWKSTGLFARLQTVKAVFREPRTATALTEIMQAYTTAVSKKRGACIACVIGGKLSEGINFTDDLARAVIIIGLPYPNVYSAFMKEKLNFLEKRFGNRSGGQRFCEALCMRSVNQAIGRSIRHAKDYAVVFLMDQRFVNNRRLRQLLPSWAQNAIRPFPSQIDILKKEMTAFFLRNSIDARQTD